MQSPRVVAFTTPGSFDASLSAAQARVPGAAEAFLIAHGGWVARTAAALVPQVRGARAGAQQ